MTAAGQIDEELALVTATVARANDEIAKGGVIDLSALETRVAELCTRLADMPRPEAGLQRGALIALLDDLAALQRKVEIGLEALAGELGETSKRRSALSAYNGGRGGE